MQITEDHIRITILLIPHSILYDQLPGYSNLINAVVIFLLLVTIGTCVLYYRRIKRVREEYEDAKGVVGDIVLSFDRQFQKQEKKLLAVMHKTGALSSESEKVASQVEDHDERLANLVNKIEAVSEIEQEFSTQIEKMDKKLDGLKESQEKVLQRIVEVEEAEFKAPAPEAKIRAVIPIKKEKALAPLTETELTVLEIIAKEGEKTAPEIRETVRLTREHTARLMKKLYEDGYLERDTHKMPYTYHLKEEMQKILKKREAKT